MKFTFDIKKEKTHEKFKFYKKMFESLLQFSTFFKKTNGFNCQKLTFLLKMYVFDFHYKKFSLRINSIYKIIKFFELFLKAANFDIFKNANYKKQKNSQDIFHKNFSKKP